MLVRRGSRLGQKAEPTARVLKPIEWPKSPYSFSLALSGFGATFAFNFASISESVSVTQSQARGVSLVTSDISEVALGTEARHLDVFLPTSVLSHPCPELSLAECRDSYYPVKNFKMAKGLWNLHLHGLSPLINQPVY